MKSKKPTYQTAVLEMGTSDDTEVIDAFRGKWEFLSNFYPHPVAVEGLIYPTTEHAFQALKTHETAERYNVQKAPTPAAAKARGRKVVLRPDWDTERFATMEAILRAKFADPVLRAKLLATGNKTLIEGNTWRDTTWGCVRDRDGNWKGQNALGKILMKLRDELQQEATTGTAEPGDWKQALIEAAVAAQEKAYTPYSHYNVGAAILTDGGRIWGGCNVENASYGLCNCAERTAVFSAVAGGEVGADKPLRAVAVVTDDGGSPCGACRQVISEFAPRDGGALPIYLCDRSGTVIRETSLGELLPLAFSLK